MVKLIRTIAYIFFFVIALIYFIPKVSLYYFAEEELQKHKAVLSKEEVIENVFSLSLYNASLSYDAIESAGIELINIRFFLFYNTLHIENIVLSEIAASFVPNKIDTLDIHYHILNPFYITAHANGEFGKADAKVHILDRNATINLIPSNVMKQKYKKTLGMLKRNEQGTYEYAKTF